MWSTGEMAMDMLASDKTSLKICILNVCHSQHEMNKYFNQKRNFSNTRKNGAVVQSLQNMYAKAYIIQTKSIKRGRGLRLPGAGCANCAACQELARSKATAHVKCRHTNAGRSHNSRKDRSRKVVPRPSVWKDKLHYIEQLQVHIKQEQCIIPLADLTYTEGTFPLPLPKKNDCRMKLGPPMLPYFLKVLLLQ